MACWCTVEIYCQALNLLHFSSVTFLNKILLYPSVKISLSTFTVHINIL